MYALTDPILDYSHSSSYPVKITFTIIAAIALTTLLCCILYVILGEIIHVYLLRAIDMVCRTTKYRVSIGDTLIF